MDRTRGKHADGVALNDTTATDAVSNIPYVDAGAGRDRQALATRGEEKKLQEAFRSPAQTFARVGSTGLG